MIKNFFLCLAVAFLSYRSCNEMTAQNKTPSDIKIVGWGDSMLAGAGGKKSPIQIASENLGHIPFTNFSVGGLRSNSIAVLQGALPFLVTIDNNSIPANGAVDITHYNIEPFNNQTVNYRYGTINKVSGTLTRIADPANPVNALKYTFERKNIGSAVPVTSPAIFKFKDSEQPGDNIVVIWCGRNDDKTSTEIYNTRDNIYAMVNNLSSYSKTHYLVLSVCNAALPGEEIGTDMHSQITNLNNLLSEAFGENYVDIRKYMVKQAIHDAGLVPTAADLDNMKRDCIPKSLMAPDNIHFNSIGYKMVGLHITSLIKQKGWIKGG